MRCGSETPTVFNFDLEQLVGDIDNTVWQITEFLFYVPI